MLPPNQHDPFKNPTWRWERARWLREKGRYARKGKDDSATVTAKQFQAEYDRVKDDLDEARLADKYPGIYHAMQLHQREDMDTRWSLEARVLGRQDVDGIAKKCRTTPEVVRWYELLFFDVRDELDHTDYVANVVMGRSIHMGVSERNYDLLWKMYAYAHGHLILDSQITKFTNPALLSSEEQVDTVYIQGHKSIAARKAHTAILTLPIAYNQQIIMETHAKLLDIEKNSAGAEASSLMTQNVNTMLQTLKFAVATDVSSVDSPRLAYYDGKSAEPRASELLAIAFGKETAGLREVLDQTPFAGAKDGSQPDQQGH